MTLSLSPGKCVLRTEHFNGTLSNEVFPTMKMSSFIAQAVERCKERKENPLTTGQSFICPNCNHIFYAGISVVSHMHNAQPFMNLDTMVYCFYIFPSSISKRKLLLLSHLVGSGYLSHYTDCFLPLPQTICFLVWEVSHR